MPADKAIVTAKDSVSQAFSNPSTTDFASYHPMVVHFPIVLLIVGAALAVVNILLKKKDYDVLVIVLAFFGGLGAVIADSWVHPHVLRGIDPTIRAVLQVHDQYAGLTKITSVAACVILIVAYFFYKKPWVKYLGILALVASAVFVGLSGHEGAKLVHLYDVGPKGNMLRVQ